jgi:hypothetical protein
MNHAQAQPGEAPGQGENVPVTDRWDPPGTERGSPAGGTSRVVGYIGRDSGFVR